MFFFASLNRTLNLSPHENICTIALIIIHYLYNIAFVIKTFILFLYMIGVPENRINETLNLKGFFGMKLAFVHRN